MNQIYYLLGTFFIDAGQKRPGITISPQKQFCPLNSESSPLLQNDGMVKIT